MMHGRIAAAILVLASGGELAFAGGPDAARGATIYERCAACHALERNRSGPRHCGLFGRRAGSLPDFNYSTAMKESGIVWNEASLDRFLENPLKTVPGTRMGYAGVKKPQDRADLIAYLKKASSDPEVCK